MEEIVSTLSILFLLGIALDRVFNVDPPTPYLVERQIVDPDENA